MNNPTPKPKQTNKRRRTTSSRPRSKTFPVVIVAGARPNFIKIAPLMRAFRAHAKQFSVRLIHTGQHYDLSMSEVFFEHLRIPKPDVSLDVGSGSHAEQTAKVMLSFEQALLKKRPGLVIVVGDVNSTVACAMVASKMQIPVAHVEAGLRSFDRTMPEEINRMVTDCLSDYLFVSEESGVTNLKKEGVAEEKIHFVGNVMIDTLLANKRAIAQSKILKTLAVEDDDDVDDVISPISVAMKSSAEPLRPGTYGVLTLHRPANVDQKETLEEIYTLMSEVVERIPVMYPIHPRTRQKMDEFHLTQKFESLNGLTLVDPLGYIDFIKLVKESAFVMTDSGGIQEESAILRVPCLTMRENTERPVTLEVGSNTLVGRDRTKIVPFVEKILRGEVRTREIPPLWDGESAARIVQILADQPLLKVQGEHG